MSRIIRCEKCSTKVAEVRDASLMKGMVTYCGKCHKDIKARLAADNGENPFNRMFGGFK